MNMLAKNKLSREFQKEVIEKELGRTFQSQWEALGTILEKDLEQDIPFYNLVTDEEVRKKANPYDERSYILSSPYFPEVYFEIQPKNFEVSDFGHLYHFAVISTTNRLQDSGSKDFDQELEEFFELTTSLPETLRTLWSMLTFVQSRALVYQLDEDNYINF